MSTRSGNSRSRSCCPPVFALLAPLIRIGLTQWRIRQIRLHRRVFTASAVGLSYGLASVAFHAIGHLAAGPEGSHLARYGFPSSDGRVAAGRGRGRACSSGRPTWPWCCPRSRAAIPAMRIRDMIFDRERVRNDVAELCVAVLVTLGTAISLFTIVFALPFVTLLQRSVRHVQLLNASRIDSKTGLLNAGTWEREAASEVARAVRTRTPLALVLVDVDHFKLVNDLHGHLAGDKALRSIAHAFRIFLRDYDLVGRFGGRGVRGAAPADQRGRRPPDRRADAPAHRGDADQHQRRPGGSPPSSSPCPWAWRRSAAPGKGRRAAS